jgi:hypothetical protein
MIYVRKLKDMEMRRSGPLSCICRIKFNEKPFSLLRTHGKNEKCVQCFVGKPERKRPLGIPRHR